MPGRVYVNAVVKRLLTVGLDGACVQNVELAVL